MNEVHGSFYPLNQYMGWRGAHAAQVSSGRQLMLGALPSGPLALENPDGSLGRLTLPRGIAISNEGTVYLLQRETLWNILRLEEHSGTFQALPGVGGAGSAARSFRHPRNLAIAGSHDHQVLSVVDTGNRRVQVFHLQTLALLQVHELPDWQPVDTAGWGQWVFILDGRHARVYRQKVGRPGGGLELLCEAASPAKWERIAIDRQGRIYCLNRLFSGAPCLDVYTAETPDGCRCHAGQGTWERFHGAGEVRDRFDPPSIVLVTDPRSGSPYHDGIFQVTGSSSNGRKGERPGSSPAGGNGPQASFDRPGPPAGWFQISGSPIDFQPDRLAEPRSYEMNGEWISQALDSGIHRCQWHRIELFLNALPPGTQLTVSTYAGPDPDLPAEPKWEKSFEAAGHAQETASPIDFLIQSRPGRYLWLKIVFVGDGFGSPEIAGMRVHYPRRSYLEYLPAIYSEESNRWFLERFLSIFQTEWDDLERRIDQISAYFDPSAVPSNGGFLENLARWLALPMEDKWDATQKRRLLQALAGYYRSLGTADGLRSFIRIHLQNMTGLEPKEQGDYPVFIEGFRRRLFESFRLQAAGTLAHGTESEDAANQTPDGRKSSFLPLWGPDKVGRLQLDRNSMLGQGRLISTGDPQRDIFEKYAHCFQVFVPAAWVSSAEDEKCLRRALDAEKPAQTAYELCLVEPRFRIGLQSTVGVDTILGDIPRTILTCPHTQSQLPASRAPHGRLGYDTVLAPRSGMLPGLPLAIDGELK